MKIPTYRPSFVHSCSIAFLALIPYFCHGQYMVEHIIADETGAQQIEFADVNYDGQDDLVFAVGARIYLMEKISSHTFAPPREIAMAGEYFALIDLDKDDTLELIVARESHIYLHIQQDTVFNAGIQIGFVISVSDFCFGDFDGDGWTDIAAGAGTKGLSNDERLIYLSNNHNLTFTTHVLGTNMRIIKKIEAIDADEDGDQDLLAYFSQDEEIRFYLNDGSGQFTLADTAIINIVGDVNTFEAVDFNHDGRKDLVLAWSDWTFSYIWGYKNLEGMTWQTQWINSFNHPGSYGSVRAKAADFEGDGDEDIFYTSSYFGELHVAINNSEAYLQDSLLFVDNRPARLIAAVGAGRVDNDSIDDPVYYSHSSSSGYLASWVEILIDTTKIGCPTGDLNFSTRNELADFIRNYPNCDTIAGSVTIGPQLSDIEDLFPMKGVKVIQGNLNLNGLWELSSLDALAELKEIGGDLTIGTKNAYDLDAFRPEKIGGDIFIHSMDRMYDLRILEAIDSIHGDLEILFTNVYSTTGLENLSYVAGTITFDRLDTIYGGIHFPALEYAGGIHITQTETPEINLGPLEQLNGPLNVEYNPKLLYMTGQLEQAKDISVNQSIYLESIAVFDSLQTVDGDFELKEIALLFNLSALERLDTVTGRLQLINVYNVDNLDFIAGMDVLGGIIFSGMFIKDVDVLEKFTEFPTDIVLFNLDSLHNVDGLRNLRSVRSFVMRSDSLLWDLSSIRDDLDISEFIILEENPLLSNCGLGFICRHLALGRDFSIEGNASGCASLAEIENACLVSTSDIAPDELLLYPNPSTGILKFKTGEQPIQFVSMSDLHGRAMPATVSADGLDVTNLPPGLYFITLANDSGTLVQKVIIE